MKVKKSHLGIFVFTLTVAILLFLSGPLVKAITVQISTDKGSYDSSDNLLNIEGTVNIDSSEFIPIKNFTIRVSGPSNKVCVFTYSSNTLSGCSNMVVSVISNYNYSNIQTGQGLWANDTKESQIYSFGYGYGYGAGSGTLEFNFTITWNISNETLNDGNYTARFEVLAQGGSTTHLFYSTSNASFGIDRAPNINSASSDSTSALPKNVGQDITFTVNWTDTGGSSSKFYICTTNSANTSGCNATQVCGNSTLSSTQVRSCAYTAQSSDSSSNTGYAFACNTLGCSSGSSVSYEVNHPPNITSIGIAPSPAYFNDTLLATPTFSDSDSDNEVNSTFKWYRNNVFIDNGSMRNQKYNDISKRDGYRYFSDAWYAAQSFTPAASRNITVLSIYVAYWSPNIASTITLEVQSDSGGEPSGTVLGSGNITGWTNNPGTYYWKNATLSSPVEVTEGTVYHIVAKVSSAVSYRLATDSSSPTYSGGSLSYSTDSGTSWTTTTRDAIFATYAAGGVRLANSNFNLSDNITFEYTPYDQHGFVGTPLNKTITIQNYAPVFSSSIANQTWNEDTSHNNRFDLDDYFSDVVGEGQSLVYSAMGNSSITISINSTTHNVSFSQPANWYGTEFVVFTASDGINTTQSNNITLTVTNVAEPGERVVESQAGLSGSSVYIPPEEVPSEEIPSEEPSEEAPSETGESFTEIKEGVFEGPAVIEEEVTEEAAVVPEEEAGPIIPLAMQRFSLILLLVLIVIMSLLIYEYRRKKKRQFEIEK